MSSINRFIIFKFFSLVMNAVSDERTTFDFDISPFNRNMGSSRIVLNKSGFSEILNDPSTKYHKTLIKVNSVLLSDIVDDIIETETTKRGSSLDSKERILIVMKMDIETHECRAIFGSKSVFQIQVSTPLQDKLGARFSDEQDRQKLQNNFLGNKPF